MNRALSILIPALATAALAAAAAPPQTPTAPTEVKPAPTEVKPAPEPAPTPPPAQPSTPVEIDRAQFTMAGPAGYKDIDDPRLAPIKDAGGLAIAREPSSQGLYAPSIMVSPIPAMKPVTSPVDCETIAGSAATASATTLKGSRLAETKAGPSCQFDLVSTSDAVRAARGTIVVGPSAWSITCNYDARDQKALADCDAATQSFTFKPGFETPAPEKAPAKGKKGKKK